MRIVLASAQLWEEILEQSGEYRIAASREEVWSALNDPDVLGACIDGCQKIDKIDEAGWPLWIKVAYKLLILMVHHSI